MSPRLGEEIMSRRLYETAFDSRAVQPAEDTDAVTNQSILSGPPIRPFPTRPSSACFPTFGRLRRLPHRTRSLRDIPHSRPRPPTPDSPSSSSVGSMDSLASWTSEGAPSWSCDSSGGSSLSSPPLATRLPLAVLSPISDKSGLEAAYSPPTTPLPRPRRAPPRPPASCTRDRDAHRCSDSGISVGSEPRPPHLLPRPSYSRSLDLPLSAAAAAPSTVTTDSLSLDLRLAPLARLENMTLDDAPSPPLASPPLKLQVSLKKTPPPSPASPRHPLSPRSSPQHLKRPSLPPLNLSKPLSSRPLSLSLSSTFSRVPANPVPPTAEEVLPFDMPKLRRLVARAAVISTPANFPAPGTGPATSRDGLKLGLRPLSLDLPAPESEPPRPNVDETLDLEYQGWYHGRISRREAESALKNQPEGSFLVRNCQTVITDYFLSLRSAWGFIHLRIQEKADGYAIGDAVKNGVFQSVPALVKHLSERRLPISGAEHIALTSPVIQNLL